MHRDGIIGELSENELRELVPQLQSLTEKYKRSERIQKALFNISEFSSTLDNFDTLYEEIHNIVSDFMLADNFFVAFHEVREEKIRFDYFVDEQDEEVVQTISYEKIKNGITAHILRTGETLVLTKENRDALQAKYNFEMVGSLPVDLIGVPIIRDNQIIGAMVVQSYRENIRYDADDLEILIFISQHIVTARDRIIHQQLTESLIAERTAQLVAANQTMEAEIAQRKRMEQLQKALFEISELSTTVDGDISNFYTKVHSILKQLINAENCYIAIVDEAGENLQFPYFVGRNEDSNNTRALTRGLTEYVIRSNQALLVDNAKIQTLAEAKEVELEFVSQLLEESNSWMGAPLHVENKVKGIIALQTYGQGEDYTETEVDLLRFVSQHISVAMERREAANELIKYNLQLTDKVKERTSELNKTNLSLKKQIEQKKEVELRLIHDAHHDSLTKLPNRVMFNSRLDLAIASKQRYQEHNFALLFIDLDRFKTINDTLGHHAGDEFLIEASKRISACKRSHDLLARLGGDEFVILIDKFNGLPDVEAVAQRIVDSISLVFVIENKEVFSGASVGVAEITAKYKKADDALRDADAAMYQAKNLGRNRYVIFDMSMRKQVIEEIDDERLFRQAFNTSQFEYAMQPIKNLDDDTTLFYECTISWPGHPKYSQAEHFWAMADKCRLTNKINNELLAEVFRLLHAWRLDPEYKNTKVSVGLSIEHLLHKSSFEELIQQIEVSRVNSELLIIQFSEQALTRFTKYAPNMLDKLQSLGISLVLENFGGHSGSLNHIFKYDFDYINLNPNLVNSFGMSDKYHRLVKAIVLIADEIGVGVIADGVDNEMTLQELNEVGCHFGKGDVVGGKFTL